MNNAPLLLTIYMFTGLFTLVTIIYVHPRLQNYIDANTMIINIWNTPLTSDKSNIIHEQVPETKTKRRFKNVLFIIVDDLRPQIGPYFDSGNPDYFSKLKIHTPSLDSLGARSMVYHRAYVQMSLCGPSRASMMTSRRPDVTRAFSNSRYWRDTGGNFTTIPQHFKNNGYSSMGFGKVYHPKESSNYDDPLSWSRPYYSPPFSDNHYMPRGSGVTGAGWAMASEAERIKVPLTDDNTVKHAREALRNLAKNNSTEQPFFMAVGFRKPHLSFVCPEKFYHLYSLENEDEFLANASWQNPTVRKKCPLSNITDTSGTLSKIQSDVLRNLRRAYFACISYMDYNVGQLVSELETQGFADDTIISFVADHGYHMGENNHFGKMITTEFANRVPLMIRVPGLTDKGIATKSIVEAVDLFPTLVELAGLSPIPSCPINCSDVQLCTQGMSLLPLLQVPNLNLKAAAYSQVTALADTNYTIRTDRLRYIERARAVQSPLPGGRIQFSADWEDQGTSWQLYDHWTDPLEQTNVAHHPKYEHHTKSLREQLHTFVEGHLVEPKII